MGQKSYITMVSISCGTNYIKFTLRYLSSEFQRPKHFDVHLEQQMVVVEDISVQQLVFSDLSLLMPRATIIQTSASLLIALS